MSKSPTYTSWRNMRQRCSNPSDTNYKYYGARGIRVCDRWQNSFVAFYADMGERPIGMTIDRKDSDGDYTPENCRWATPTEQHNNQRSNVLHTIGGVTKNTTQWLKHFEIKKSTFSTRLYVYHWPLIKALTTPTRKRG